MRDGSRSRILQENVSTGVTAQFTGCRSTNLDIEGQFVPTITEDSISLPVKVDPESWNCVAGNISNTLCVIGQSNKPLEDAIARLQSQVLPRGIMREIGNLFRKEGYHTFPLPQDMDFEALTTLANRLSLPMFISLNIGDHVNYQHVIGICPYKSSSTSSTSLQIIDGTHPSLQPFPYSRENFDWCGVRNPNPTNADCIGFAFYPAVRLTKCLTIQIRKNLNTQHPPTLTTVCLALEFSNPKTKQNKKANDFIRRENIVRYALPIYRSIIAEASIVNH